MDASESGNKRAKKLKTKNQAKLAVLEDRRRELSALGLTANEYWTQNVRSEQDIVDFYEIYHPEYPDALAKAIAIRISGIIEKSKRGEALSEDEKDYYRRSQQEPRQWDFKAELKQQEMAGKVKLAMERLGNLAM